MSRRTTRQGSILWLALSLAFPAPARAQESLTDLIPFREGCQALADERFGTAVAHFRDCWDLLEQGENTGPEGNFVAARLLEALVKDGSTVEAVSWFDAKDGFLPTPATSYWIAVALEAEERFAEAAEHYQIHLAATHGAPTSILLKRAVCLSRSGQHETAYDLVASAPRPSSPDEALRLAQIAAAAGRFREALAFLPEADPEDPKWSPLRLSLTRLRSSLLWQQGDRGGAITSVFALIDLATSKEEARQGFLLLERLLEGERPAGLFEQVKARSGSAHYPGKETARLFEIILLAETQARESGLRTFANSATDPSLKAEALLRLSEPTDADPSDLAIDLRERIGFSIGSRAYLAGAFTEAARHFTTLAKETKGEAASRNLFNAAIAALRGEDFETFAALEETLARLHPRSGSLADLSYLSALHFAARGHPTAFDRLTAFVQEHPGHASHVDALLALAEIHLNQAPARSRAAREIFDALRTRPLTLAQSERLDYNSVWVELTEGDDPALLRRATEFVASWPASRYLGEVLMILATEQVARKNFEAAANSFRRVAEEFPGSPHAETARFFEAKTSPATDGSMATWRRLVDARGPLAHEAAHELALLLLSLDRFEEARAELTALLDRLDENAPLRFAIMADLAYAFYLEALATGRDAAKLSAAADRFAALSNLDSAPALWRYNAAVRRGKCLEALDKRSVALEIYRSIVEETRSQKTGFAPSLPPGETEWVFRAGFAAIEILNAEKNWSASIDVADALAEKSGPRAIEATRLAEKLRLQHWVWD